jgi:glycerophosphoryl diester phosphodiesterase
MVAKRLSDVAPPANLGHRGTGPTRPGHPYPENSISAFLAAIDQGANGVELDVGLSRDAEILVMHDDRLDRTTDCSGCLSAMRLDDLRACRLLDGDGQPTEEHPPTLAEVYAALPERSLINVEIKMVGAACAGRQSEPALLVEAVLEEVIRLGEESRTLFSSFDEDVVGLIKELKPRLYCALVSKAPDRTLVDRALALGQDAIHPNHCVSAETVRAALDAGLGVIVWDANTAEHMRAALDKGVTGIITNEPAVLAELLDGVR